MKNLRCLLANDINDVKCLLVHQDLFDRTVDAKGIKKRLHRKTSCIFNYDNKKESTEQDLGRQGSTICWIV